MKKETGISIGVLLVIWSGTSMIINNQNLFPSLFQVMGIMMNQLVSFSFYSSCFSTVLHLFEGLLPAIVISFILAFLGFYFKQVQLFFHPILVLMKSIPTVSYVFLVLLLIGRNGTCSVVSFLVVFPIIYQNMVDGLNHLDESLLAVMKVYPSPLKTQICKILFPQCLSYFHSAMKTSLGLGFKVSVMAEILAQVNDGIGRQLQIAKNSFEMGDLFAWTIWIVIISYLLEMGYHLIFEKEMKEC